MTKKTRIYFIHRHINTLSAFLKVVNLQEQEKRLEWDPLHPEILFASEWIYYDEACSQEFRSLWPKVRLRVMMAFEAINPDMNLFDYAFGFNNMVNYEGDRFIRLLSPIHLFTNFISCTENAIRDLEAAKACLFSKTGFCNFLYTNGSAHPMRDQLFYELSKYKKVDSLGKHLNNVGRPGTGYAGHQKEGIEIKSRYKFSIASENACFRGYTSEKVFTSFIAHTVPIYWGNPDVMEDVNPKAIINASDYSSFDELRSFVEYVDTHDDVWAEMVSRPWMTNEQLEKHNERTRVFVERFKSILFGDLNDLQRLAQGAHQDYYRKRLLEDKFQKAPKFNKIRRYFRRYF